MLKKFVACFIALLLFLSTLIGIFWIYEKLTGGSKTLSEIRVERGGHRSFQRASGLPRFPLEKSFNGGSNGVLRIIKKRSNNVISDRTYNLDQFSLRKINTENPEKSKGHIIFAGCSYVFGQGLQDNESLPQIFENHNIDFDSYNLGFMGGNIGHVLFHFDKVKINSYVDEKKGVLLFNMIQGHLNRWHLRSDYLHWASPGFPVYVKRNSEIVFNGLLKNQPEYKFYQFIKNLGLEDTHLKLIELFRNKDEFTDEEINEYVLALKWLKKIYLNSFPEGRFVLLFHPQGNFSDKVKLRMKSDLDLMAIEYLDPFVEYEAFRKNPLFTHEDLHAPHDGHPSGKVNTFIADYLASRLK